jgi:diaminopimelate epimerase
MSFSTSLISGAGNTFHITWKNPIQNKDHQKIIAQKICSQNQADGFIFLNSTDSLNKNFIWNFYNNDGSDAEMCGNATRCVGFFIKNKLLSQNSIYNLSTVAGPIQIESLTNESFKIQMTEIIRLPHEKYFYCDTGVPHIVIEFLDFNNYKNNSKYCRDLRFHKDFLPRGTNVTLILKTDSPEFLRAVSYERGVENFTQACGTGAMAAAYYNYIKYGQIISTVQMPGGDLILNLENLKKPLMTGPAVLIGDHTYDDKI